MRFCMTEHIELVYTDMASSLMDTDVVWSDVTRHCPAGILKYVDTI